MALWFLQCKDDFSNRAVVFVILRLLVKNTSASEKTSTSGHFGRNKGCRAAAYQGTRKNNALLTLCQGLSVVQVPSVPYSPGPYSFHSLRELGWGV